MLEHSEGKDDSIVANTMEKLQLVNQHWSSWATRTIRVLWPPNVPLETLVEMLGERFVNVRSLDLDNITIIDGEGLLTPCKLSILTIPDVTSTCTIL